MLEGVEAKLLRKAQLAGSRLDVGAEIKEYRGHRARVLTLMYTPDGKYLVSGSEDTTALVWKLP